MLSRTLLALYYDMHRWLDSGIGDGLIERQLDVVDYVEKQPLFEPLEAETGFFSVSAVTSSSAIAERPRCKVC